MSVSLTDHYVLLLEKVVAENNAVREQVKVMAENDKQSLADLHKKIDNLKTTSSRRVRQCGPAVRVPKMCRNDVRRKLKLAEKAGNGTLRLNEGLESEHNLKVFHGLVNQLKHEYGGEDKCPWTLLHVKGALKTYYKSKKTQQKRMQNGTRGLHNAKCRRQARKRDKVGKRLGGLVAKTWSTEKKAKAAEVMTVEYMSSEESDQDPEPPHRTTQYLVRPFAWESDELKKIKKSLDKAHRRTLPDLVKRRTLPRNPGRPSTQGKPESCPKWACKTVAEGGTPPVATSSPEQPSPEANSATDHTSSTPNGNSTSHDDSDACSARRRIITRSNS